VITFKRGALYQRIGRCAWQISVFAMILATNKKPGSKPGFRRYGMSA
jgi:hypothetical protein